MMDRETFAALVSSAAIADFRVRVFFSWWPLCSSMRIFWPIKSSFEWIFFQVVGVYHYKTIHQIKARFLLLSLLFVVVVVVTIAICSYHCYLLLPLLFVVAIAICCCHCFVLLSLISVVVVAICYCRGYMLLSLSSLSVVVAVVISCCSNL